MSLYSQSVKIIEFQKGIINYWENAGRKDFLWRQTEDPWKVLLAEVLLRKTTSKQVVKVYKELSAKTIREINLMKINELVTILKPLGIQYLRAKQIKEIAFIIDKNGSDLLRDESFVMSLPGVGKYIFCTLQCFAYNVNKPALDTNMIRIIQRHFNYKSRKSRARDDNELWEFAHQLLPSEKCKEFNWGILDLGWAVCKAHKPLCINCTVDKYCSYKGGNLVDTKAK